MEKLLKAKTKVFGYPVVFAGAEGYSKIFIGVGNNGHVSEFQLMDFRDEKLTRDFFRKEVKEFIKEAKANKEDFLQEVQYCSDFERSLEFHKGIMGNTPYKLVYVNL